MCYCLLDIQFLRSAFFLNLIMGPFYSGCVSSLKVANPDLPLSFQGNCTLSSIMEMTR